MRPPPGLRNASPGPRQPPLQRLASCFYRLLSLPSRSTCARAILPGVGALQAGPAEPQVVTLSEETRQMAERRGSAEFRAPDRWGRKNLRSTAQQESHCRAQIGAALPCTRVQVGRGAGRAAYTTSCWHGQRELRPEEDAGAHDGQRGHGSSWKAASPCGCCSDGAGACSHLRGAVGVTHSSCLISRLDLLAEHPAFNNFTESGAPELPRSPRWESKAADPAGSMGRASLY